MEEIMQATNLDVKWPFKFAVGMNPQCDERRTRSPVRGTGSGLCSSQTSCEDLDRLCRKWCIDGFYKSTQNHDKIRWRSSCWKECAITTETVFKAVNTAFLSQFDFCHKRKVPFFSSNTVKPLVFGTLVGTHCAEACKSEKCQSAMAYWFQRGRTGSARHCGWPQVHRSGCRRWPRRSVRQIRRRLGKKPRLGQRGWWRTGRHTLDIAVSLDDWFHHLKFSRLGFEISLRFLLHSFLCWFLSKEDISHVLHSGFQHVTMWLPTILWFFQDPSCKFRRQHFDTFSGGRITFHSKDKYSAVNVPIGFCRCFLKESF